MTTKGHLRGALVATVCVIAFAACSDSGEAAPPAPAEQAAIPAPATPAPVATPEPPPLPDPLAIGSPDAKDDLYCSGVLIAAFPTPMDAQVPVEQARIERGQTNAIILGETGIQKLIKEGAAVSGQAAQILDAWAVSAGKDFDAGKPRLSADTCSARAEARVPLQ
jgi:hypothetical protein